MLISEVFKFLFLQKVTFSVSKCIICDFSSYSSWGFSSANYNKPRSKLLFLLIISCFVFKIWMLQEINLKSSNKLRPKLKIAMAPVNLGEFMTISFMLPRECARRMFKRFQQWLRSLLGGVHEKASTMAEVAFEPTCQGGFGDGRHHSRT